MASFSCKQEKTETAPKQNNTETATPAEKQQIVSLSGGITEIISALGYQSEIVGTDVTSTYPESLKTTATELGHVRSMAIEPVMALHPSLILANKKDMNPELLKKLEASGTKLDLLEQEYSVQGTKKLIRQVAEILGSQDYRKLNEKIDADLAQLKPIARKPKVLFSRPCTAETYSQKTKSPLHLRTRQQPDGGRERDSDGGTDWHCRRRKCSKRL